MEKSKYPQNFPFFPLQTVPHWNKTAIYYNSCCKIWRMNVVFIAKVVLIEKYEKDF